MLIGAIVELWLGEGRRAITRTYRDAAFRPTCLESCAARLTAIPWDARVICLYGLMPRNHGGGGQVRIPFMCKHSDQGEMRRGERSSVDSRVATGRRERWPMGWRKKREDYLVRRRPLRENALCVADRPSLSGGACRKPRAGGLSDESSANTVGVGSRGQAGIQLDPALSNEQACEARDYHGAVVTYQQVCLAPDVFPARLPKTGKLW